MRPESWPAVSVPILVAGLLTVAALEPSHAADPFRLRSGARGKVCLGCHTDFAALLKKRSVHTPIAKGDCSGCHSPHASDHAKLLAAEGAAVCRECHDDLVPAQAVSVHEVVAKEECTSCHDPHASDYRKNLVKGGSSLCFECHQDMKEKISKNRYPHEPVQDDCLNCHDPHASTRSAKLLVDEQPALCLDCHDSGSASFKRLHKGYPVDRGRCSTCHDPHGSNTAGLLFDNVHPPVAQKRCEQCHRGTSASPFALKDEGFKLCEGCHYEEVADMLNKERIHWPIMDERGCRNCHAPHASPAGHLLRAPMLTLCAECHEDTVARQERAPTKHPPVAEGDCTDCHQPHASDNLFLANEASPIDLCATCHDWQAHSTHPIGKKITDPRNENLTVSCSSCHRAHGTEYPHFLYFETTNEMCVQCHSQYRR